MSTPIPAQSPAQPAILQASVRALPSRGGFTALVGARRLGVFERMTEALAALSRTAVAQGITLVVTVREQGKQPRYLTLGPDGSQVRSAPPANPVRDQRDLGKGGDPAAAVEWLEGQMWGSGS